MAEHELKIQKTFADAIARGEKTFEVRYNADRGFQKGDIVNFIVIDKGEECPRHRLNGMKFEIDYVLSGYGLDKDYVAFSIRRVSNG